MQSTDGIRGTVRLYISLWRLSTMLINSGFHWLASHTPGVQNARFVSHECIQVEALIIVGSL